MATLLNRLITGDNSFLFGMRSIELKKHPEEELGHPKMHVKMKKVFA